MNSVLRDIEDMVEIVREDAEVTDSIKEMIRDIKDKNRLDALLITAAGVETIEDFECVLQGKEETDIFCK